MTNSDTSPPDRLSLDPRSKHFDADILQRGIGVRFKEIERHNVIEYCISDEWIRVQAGTSNDRYGNPMTIKLRGPVEVWFKDSEGDQEASSEEE